MNLISSSFCEIQLSYTNFYINRSYLFSPLKTDVT